jgi:hypothetical protein
MTIIVKQRLVMNSFPFIWKRILTNIFAIKNNVSGVIGLEDEVTNGHFSDEQETT